MRHLVCTVKGGTYTITENGVTIETKAVPLEKFTDVDGNVKAINPTWNKAWEEVQRLSQ